MNDVHARIGAEIFLQQFAGAISGTVIDDDNFHVGIIGGERGRDCLYDCFFFVVRGNQNADERLKFRMIAGIGAHFFDEREQANNNCASADQHECPE